MADKDSGKEFQAAEKLYEARQQRIDARAGKGIPFGEMERIYKARLDYSLAQKARADQERVLLSAKCSWLAQRARVLELENAKLRRLLRAHGHVRVDV